MANELTAKILIVHHKPDRRAFLSRVLRSPGIVPLTASTKHEALQITPETVEGLRFCVISSDLPSRGGGLLAAKLASMRPDLPILLIGSDPNPPASYASHPSWSYLQGPATEEQLHRFKGEFIAKAQPQELVAQGTEFLLEVPLRAVSLEGAKGLLCSIPDGSRVQYRGDGEPGGMIRLLWQDRNYLAFPQDLESRGNQITD